jgi:hypothetical protein
VAHPEKKRIIRDADINRITDLKDISGKNLMVSRINGRRTLSNAVLSVLYLLCKI